MEKKKPNNLAKITRFIDTYLISKPRHRSSIGSTAAGGAWDLFSISTASRAVVKEKNKFERRKIYKYVIINVSLIILFFVFRTKIKNTISESIDIYSFSLVLLLCNAAVLLFVRIFWGKQEARYMVLGSLLWIALWVAFLVTVLLIMAGLALH